MVQLSHPYVTPGKTIALTLWTFVCKVTCLLFKTLSRFVIAFLSRSKHLLISWLQPPSAMILGELMIQFHFESDNPRTRRTGRVNSSLKTKGRRTLVSQLKGSTAERVNSLFTQLFVSYWSQWIEQTPPPWGRAICFTQSTDPNLVWGDL